jgi:hypothetical protein
VTTATVMRAAAIIMRYRRADFPRISIRLHCAGIALKV